MICSLGPGLYGFVRMGVCFFVWALFWELSTAKSCVVFIVLQLWEYLSSGSIISNMLRPAINSLHKNLCVAQFLSNIAPLSCQTPCLVLQRGYIALNGFLTGFASTGFNLMLFSIFGRGNSSEGHIPLMFPNEFQ